ncbi:MAG: hypothetical protein PVI90_03800 [Desulfobacteraceae bacterium]|jgi:hypothetical protein
MGEISLTKHKKIKEELSGNEEIYLFNPYLKLEYKNIIFEKLFLYIAIVADWRYFFVGVNGGTSTIGEDDINNDLVLKFNTSVKCEF